MPPALHEPAPEFKAAYDLIKGSIPPDRICGMDDMNGVAVFPTSDASAYMTGHVLVNDGGQIAKKTWEQVNR